MKPHSLVLVLAAGLLTAGALRAEQPVVTNVRAEQRPYPSHLVDIWYDVADLEGDELYVALAVSDNGGGTWTVPVATVSGAVGAGVTAGLNRHVVWDAGADAPGLDEDDMKVRVSAWDYGQVGDMTLIPAGQFMMGQAGVATPEHLVTLTNDFLLGRTEVTNQQYLEALQWAYDHPAQTGVSATASTVTAYGVELLDLDATNYCEIAFNTGTQQFYLVARTYNGGTWGPGFAYPGGSYDPGLHPVKEVSWYGAACYCDWRSLMEGLPAYYNGQWSQTPSPNNPYTAAGYRLPTEAEWEFAAQWDDEREYPWGPAAPNCSLANYQPSGYCVGWTTPVGSYPAGASARGLLDMAGNLREWCNDWYASYSAGSVSDPPGPSGGSLRVLRGGSWRNSAAYLRCAYRSNYPPSAAHYHFGFRLCRTLD
jgi:formylglycine-generating enzyme required for sulfatase activity